MKNIEQGLMRGIIEKFIETTGLEIFVKQNFNKEDYTRDFQIEITAETKKWEFDVIIKNKLNEAVLGLLIEVVKNKPMKTIIMTDYVNPNLAGKMKELGLNYMDNAGNLFVKNLPLYIEVTGQKLETRLETKRKERLFNAPGLQIIFGMLCKPGLENANYREIANVTGVALGTVGWILRALKVRGFLIEQNGQRKLLNKEKLFEMWVAEYREKLKPKQLRGIYTTDKQKWWENIDIAKYDALWGGEVGATKLDNYLKPGITTVYARGNTINRLIAKEHMRKHPEGNIEVMNQFWKFETKFDNKTITHPILIYADLMGTGDERNFEMAKLIYEKNIVQYIKEN